ncbi:MAG: carbamoyltransferase HypF [Candidatus Hodarchaeaceae archaeon]|nr:carbamoyltransferase HypF [Candidatus Hodarchaeaceae archaeon]
MRARAEVAVTGIVQGVGFRPFIFKLATRHGLVGFARNMGDAGVQVVVEGEMGAIEKFIDSIRTERPPLSRIDEIEVAWKSPTDEFTIFQVVPSERAGLGLPSVVPPDLALCDDCLREMLDPSDRRYLYPFITCVNCGPRFTIIEELPYDRPRTSMKSFPLCADCLREYQEPSDRRYHAEPTCCPACGPRMQLHDAGGERIESPKPLREAARLLDEGNILAIKGIGGIHIAARTTDDEVLKRLRGAFNRPQQPFAVMSKDLETVRTFARVNQAEVELLTSYRWPIVVLERLPNCELSELVAPGLDSVGVMLPYSGIHHLILRHGREPAYVMTSANLPGLPMLTDNAEALAKLRDAVDYLLLHDRAIVNRCDDSVVKVVDGGPSFLRRSRGWVPEPIKLAFKGGAKVVALGAELNVTASALVGDRCFVSQHIGDTTKVETIEYLQAAVKRLMCLLNLDRVDVVAHDLHPYYSTTRVAPRMAEELKAKAVAVQHHHAHLCSLMAEHGLGELVGIAADGVGYGSDGTIWGGEVLIADLKSFERVGGLMKQPMPGGDLATRFPARMVAGMLWQVLTPAEVERALKDFCTNGFRHGELELRVVLRQLERNLNVFWTSSCGRALDAVACLLGVCSERTYEGEPAIKLEAAANGGDADRWKLEPTLKNVDGVSVIDTSQLLVGVLDALRNGVPRRHIAAAAQRAMAEGLAEVAIEAASRSGISAVGGSGGVFYNRAMTLSVRRLVEGAGLKFFAHELLPPGDGGISVGQAIAAARAVE